MKTSEPSLALVRCAKVMSNVDLGKSIFKVFDQNRTKYRIDTSTIFFCFLMLDTKAIVSRTVILRALKNTSIDRSPLDLSNGTQLFVVISAVVLEIIALENR